MKNNGVIEKSTQEQAIRLMKQKILNEYLFQLLKPIKEYEHYGMILQVGTNNPKVLRCFSQICMFSGDSEQLHKLCSVSYQSKTANVDFNVLKMLLFLFSHGMIILNIEILIQHSTCLLIWSLYFAIKFAKQAIFHCIEHRNTIQLI